jgi:replicative DNA helicase
MYRQFVLLSVEKNRDGPASIDLEFRKDFPSYRFEPRGSFVAEQLIDDVLFEE